MQAKLKNKVCLVVGGSRDIGLSVAKCIYNLGATVIISGRSGKSVNEVVLSVDPSGKKFIGYKADVAKEKEIDGMIKQIITDFGKIDILINLAGIFKPFGLFDEVPFTDNIKPVEVNLIGAMRVCYKVIPFMKKQKFGRIILFSGGGIGGDTPMVYAASYYTSKGAIVLLTEVLAREVSKFNITVNAILPGQILTKSTQSTFSLSDEQLGPILSKATRRLQKSGGNSIDSVVNLITFLLSSKGKHVTGRLLSARWDDLNMLSQKLPDEKYKLRRIEGRIYKKVV